MSIAKKEKQNASSTWSPKQRQFHFTIALAGPLLLFVALCSAYAANLPQQLGLHSGREIYTAACAACHGANGEGTPETTTGFVRPNTFPHFNQCDETTPESTRDWTAVIRDGGPGRGFSEIMPSFSGVLTAEQIDQVVAYLRGLCTDQEWPRGELNVPRALVTEKAFPESETVLTMAFNAKGAPGISNELAYEQILGKRDQLEVAIPFGWVHKESGGLYGGVGDLAVGIKHVLFSNLARKPSEPIYDNTGSIFSVQGEISLPTGNKEKGLGSGETRFGVFAAYDQLLPARAFIQVQAGADLPVHTEETPRSGFLYTAFGKTFSSDPFGRMWTPMIEVLADRDLVRGATTDWDLAPEFQVTLNRRQHVRAALGYRFPLNDTADRSREVIAYFLWDWFDGGLLEGW